MSEILTWRALGAVRLVEAAGHRPLARELHVFSAALHFTRNRSGLHVITRAPGLESHAGVFDAADLPAVAPRAFSAWVEDPMGQYQARAFSVTLPRDPAPPARGAAPAAGSLFAVEEVEVLPAAGAPTGVSDAVLRVRALRATDLSAFPWLLVRASGPGPDQIGWGLTDVRGEALVAVPGLPRFSEAGGTLTERTPLALTFIPMPPPAPAAPPGSRSHPARPLPGNFQDWRAFAEQPGRPATLAAGGPPVIEAAPGRELPVTVHVTP